MRVFLTSLADPSNWTLEKLRRIAKACPPGQASLCNSAAEADLILLVDYGYLGWEHLTKVQALQSQFPRARLAAFNESDWPCPFLPGLYPSLGRPLPWASSWSYLLDLMAPDALPDAQPDLLFSFVGRISTHPVRSRLKQLDGAETPVLDLSEAEERYPGWDHVTSYLDLIARSRFVLCPRGYGPSSIRVFETLRQGRVPVIISDDWFAPPVADWQAFTVRVPESEIANIPDILASKSDSWDEMAVRARQVFDRHFRPELLIDRMIDLALADKASSGLAGRVLRTASMRHLRAFVGSLMS